MPQTPAKGRTARLSREVVAAAAVELLDEHGERGLTFKLLTERLKTGAGALYWHVANKDDLVRLAADRVMGDALTGGADASLHTLALAIYDTFERHPWAASHIGVVPPQPNALRLLDRIGTLVAKTTLPPERHFVTATAIFNFVTSVTAQESSNAATAAAGVSRDTVLAELAAQWEALDPAAFPFLTRAAADLRDHDDRDQFVAGLDLLLDGLRLQELKLDTATDPDRP
ncbi:TetR/AcrR family transcriptional regulator [Dactylosporangium maewongense]|uniref:TetR/AcrR family transcriptional regulator n=1 Tax=Dactylosporangium maewongense TaxID=634393 RepID=A0ABP4NB43_9ACTN